MSHDIIVVGAGPAGLTAAVTAAADGFSVLLVETKEHIARQTRPCCSMWLVEPGFHNETCTFNDEKIFFHRNDFCIPYNGKIVDLHRSKRISAGGHCMTMGKKIMPIGRVIDKSNLLNGLLTEVEKRNVDIRQRTTCLGIEVSEKGVKARLRHQGAEEWAEAKYLLAADGVDSRIVQSMGMNKTRKIIIRTPMLHYYFADVQTPHKNCWVQFIGDGFNGVSGTMLHKPDSEGNRDIFEIGAVPPLKSGMGAKEAMDRLIAHPMLQEWLSPARLIKKMGCRWTLWTPVPEPAQNRVIIIGDAASFQEVENQGAIMCGYRAARAVAAEESGENGFAGYNRFWQQSFEFNDPDILKDTWKAFIFGYLGNENIDYLLGLAQGKLLDGYVNHFTCADVIFDFFKEQLPRIEKERPELAVKIKKFDNFNVEEHIVGEIST